MIRTSLYVHLDGFSWSKAREAEMLTLYDDLGLLIKEVRPLVDSVILGYPHVYDRAAAPTEHVEAAQRAGLNVILCRSTSPRNWYDPTETEGNGRLPVWQDLFSAAYWLQQITRTKAEAAALGCESCLDYEPYGEHNPHNGFNRLGPREGWAIRRAVEQAVELAGRVDYATPGPSAWPIDRANSIFNYGSAMAPIAHCNICQVPYKFRHGKYPVQEKWDLPEYATPLDTWGRGITTETAKPSDSDDDQKPWTVSEFVNFDPQTVTERHPEVTHVMWYPDNPKSNNFPNGDPIARILEAVKLKRGR